MVTRAPAPSAAGKPVVMAAYQHVYDSAPAAVSDLSTALTMATLFSHGATHLLCGEADRILVDPYYVRNHVMEPSTTALLKRWYDFLVAHDELLMPADLTDVTGPMPAPTTTNSTSASRRRRHRAALGRRHGLAPHRPGAGDRLVDSPDQPDRAGRHAVGRRPQPSRRPGTGHLADSADG